MKQVVVAEYHIVKLLREVVCDVDTCRKWLQTHGLLTSTYPCYNCGRRAMTIQNVTNLLEENRRQYEIDRVCFQCPTCQRTESVRSGSVFQRSPSVPLTVLLKMIHWWCQDMLPTEIDLMSEMNDRAEVVKWCDFLKDISIEHLLRHPETVGGENCMVKIRLVGASCGSRPWFLGGIDETNGKAFLSEVPNLTKEEVQRILTRFVVRGSRLGYVAKDFCDNVVRMFEENSFRTSNIQFTKEGDTIVLMNDVTWLAKFLFFKRHRGNGGASHYFADILNAIAEQYTLW